jgi:hypothetical protein
MEWQLAGGPAIVDPVHVGIVLNAAPQRAGEVPEPVRTHDVPSRPPGADIAQPGEARSRRHHFARSAGVEGEMLDAFHLRRGLDQKHGVVFGAGSRAQERAAAKPVGDAETEAADVEALRRAEIGDEIGEVGKRAQRRPRSG